MPRHSSATQERPALRRPLLRDPADGSSQAPPSGSSRSLAVELDEKKIDAVFAALDQCHLPGAAVGVAVGGRPMYRKGFGLANMELPVVLTPTMRMRIYSTTKHFTCLAYLLLCEEGKASLDDPIGKHLPELQPAARGVTVRQLMGHLGGLRDVHDLCYQFSGTGKPLSTADLFSYYSTISDVNCAPGTAWVYSNGGYLLLSVAIERLTGQSLEDVLRERIFVPVGMHDTLLRRFDTDFVPNSATMHTTLATGGFDKSYLGIAWAGEGGMVSTVDDMLRWLAHMDVPHVGSAVTWTLMKTPLTLANGTSSGYGLGLIRSHYRGVEILHHPGGGMGANSEMLKVPAVGLDVAIMTNRQDVTGDELAYRILDACLSGLDAVADAPPGPQAIGLFRSPKTGRVIQLRTAVGAIAPAIREGQQIAVVDGLDIPVEPDDVGALSPAGVYGHMRMQLVLNGDPRAPASIHFVDFGNADELVRVEPAGIPDARAIAGRYRSQSTHTDATILAAEDGATLATAGRFGEARFRLECLADGIWRATSASSMPWGGILLFDGDGASFGFSNYRTRSLSFRRVV